MFAIVATSVARPRCPGGARSTSVAAAVPVKIPAESPDSTRPSSRNPSALASRNATALSAEKPSPINSTGRRPT